VALTRTLGRCVTIVGSPKRWLDPGSLSLSCFRGSRPDVLRFLMRPRREFGLIAGATLGAVTGACGGVIPGQEQAAASYDLRVFPIRGISWLVFLRQCEAP
jgi:hypothetical protein